MGYNLLSADMIGSAVSLRSYPMGILAITKMGRSMGEMAHKIFDCPFLWCNALFRRFLCLIVV